MSPSHSLHSQRLGHDNIRSSSKSPEISSHSRSLSSANPTPNIPLSLPRWGGPPPPPLPHHPHSTIPAWNNRQRSDSIGSGSASASASASASGSGSISLAKITGPPASSSTEYYRTPSSLSDYAHTPAPSSSHNHNFSGSGGFGKIRESDYQSQRSGPSYEREVSESPSQGQGQGKKRRRGSEKPTIMEDMDDRPLAITCAPCRSRKIKCDSKKPTCENCAKTPHECYYPVKLKPGLRPGAGMDVMRRVELLEERLSSYESRLADQDARLSHLSYSQSHSQLQPLMNPPTTTSASTSTSLNQQQYIPTPTATLPPTLSHGFDMQADFNPNPSSLLGHTASPSGLSTTSFRDPQVLPPDDIVRDLIVLFFTHIHPWAPILSPTIPNYTQPWNIVVHAIVVVTLRLSADPRLNPPGGDIKQAYRAAAKQHILAHAIESTSIDSVQALALLALDLIGSEQGPSSWGILALLTRSAVHLGLASEEDTSHNLGGRAPTPSLSRTSIIPPVASWHEDELRRRLFWLIFCLDRYACVSTGWDFALPDFDIKRRLPASDEIWAKNEWYQAPKFKPVLHRDLPPDPSTLSPLAYLVEALDLLGRAHTLQSQVIEPGDIRAVEVRKDQTMTLTSSAKRWFGDLGSGLKEAYRQDSMTLMIQAIHHATLLKLNAYYAFPALSNGEPQEPYTSTCLHATRAIVALTNQARELGFQRSSSPLFIWSSWVAARVLFVHSFLSHRTQPDEDFDLIVNALKEQSQYWTLANQYSKLLERAKRKWLSPTLPSDHNHNPNLPEAIHVLLDLRRTAYSAVATGAGVSVEATPHVSPPDVDLSHLPVWAVQPLLGDLHDWFDLPAGLFQSDM